MGEVTVDSETEKLIWEILSIVPDAHTYSIVWGEKGGKVFTTHVRLIDFHCRASPGQSCRSR